MEEHLDAVAVVSDRGHRHHRNEDYFAVSHTFSPSGTDVVVAVVCDGVSSSTRPDEASATAARVACTSLHENLPNGVPARQAMHEALSRAGEAVSALADPHRSPEENSPACTLVSSVIMENILTVGWVGDSRAYWIPDDRGSVPARLTEDDSWAAQMVAAGLMGEAEAYADPRAHAITGWLGADAYELEPHAVSFSPEEPGVIIVCTDGLWNYAEAARDMAAVVPAHARTERLSAARELVDFALRRGGHDNVTVAVLPFPSPPARAGSA